MAPASFDLDGARREGYNDTEIADYLAGSKGFDIAGARKEGYSDLEIIGHLNKPPAMKVPGAERTGVPSVGMVSPPVDLGGTTRVQSSAPPQPAVLGRPTPQPALVPDYLASEGTTGLTPPPPTPQAADRGIVEGTFGAFDEGISQAKGMVGAGLEAVGNSAAYGAPRGMQPAFDAVTRAGEYLNRPRDYTPRATFQDVWNKPSVGGAVQWAAESGAQAIPNLAAVVGASVVGGPVAGAGLGYLMNTGEIYDDLRAKGIDAPRAAMAAGIPATALDYIEPLRIASSIKGTPLKEAIKQSFLRRAGRVAAEGGLESTTEALQKGVGIGAEWGVTGQAPDPKAALWEMVNEGAAAFLPGAAGGSVQQIAEVRNRNNDAMAPVRDYLDERAANQNQPLGIQPTVAPSPIEAPAVTPAPAADLGLVPPLEGPPPAPAIPLTPFQQEENLAPEPAETAPPLPQQRPIADPEAVYEDAKVYAGKFQELGVSALVKKFGVSRDGARAILDRLVEEGQFTTKPLKDGGTSFVNLAIKRDRAGKKPVIVKADAPIAQVQREEVVQERAPIAEGVPPDSPSVQAPSVQSSVENQQQALLGEGEAPAPASAEQSPEMAAAAYDELIGQERSLQNGPTYSWENPEMRQRMRDIWAKKEALRPAVIAHQAAQRAAEGRPSDVEAKPRDGDLAQDLATPPPPGDLKVQERQDGKTTTLSYYTPNGTYVGFGKFTGNLSLGVNVEPKLRRLGYGKRIHEDLEKRGVTDSVAGTDEGRALLESRGWVPEREGADEFHPPAAPDLAEVPSIEAPQPAAEPAKSAIRQVDIEPAPDMKPLEKPPAPKTRMQPKPGGGYEIVPVEPAVDLAPVSSPEEQAKPPAPVEVAPAGSKAMAQRIVNAENNFIQTIMNRGFTREEAEKAMRTMLKLKAAKLDAVNGVISVKHGALLESDAIRKAVDYEPPVKGKGKAKEAPVAAAPQESLPSFAQSATLPPDAGTVQQGTTRKGAEVLEPREPQTKPSRGTDTDILIPGESSRYKATYAVRELADVHPSHIGQTFQPNPSYQLKNERDYGDPSNQERVVLNSSPNLFEPAYLITDNPDVTNGPPAIDPQGNVLGGNSRAMILQRVHGSPALAGKYRAALEAKAKQYGIDPATIAGMKEPVLVREISEEELSRIPNGRKTVIRATNKTGTAALTATERAAADAGQMSEGMADHIAAALEDAGNDATIADVLSTSRGPDIINRLVEDGVFTTQEKSELVDAKTKAVTAEGKTRVQKALVGRLFRDSKQIARTPAGIVAKLERVVGPVMRLQSNKEWALEELVREAIDVLEYSRAHDTKNLSDLTAQQGLFGDTPQFSDQAVRLAGLIRDKAPNEVSRVIKRYAANSVPTMFGELTQQEGFDEAFGGETKAAPTETKAEPEGKLSKAKAAADERLSKRGISSGSTLSANAFLDPRVIRDMAISIAGDVAKGVVTAKNFVSAITQRFGNGARNVARKVFRRAQAVNRQQGQQTTQAAPATTPAVQRSARFEQVRETMAPAKVEKEKTRTEKLRETLATVWHSMTRQFMHLPGGARYAELRQFLNRVAKAKGTTIHRAAQAIIDQLETLDADEYSAFLDTVALNDLVARVKQSIQEGTPVGNDDLPWGIKSKQELYALRREANAIAQANPKIVEALRKRKEMWDLVKTEYITAMGKVGYDVSKTVSREDYFRHRVLEHLEAKERIGQEGTGAGQRFKLPTGRGWLKKSHVNKADYSLDYIRAEFEVLSEMMYDTARAEFLAWLKDKSGHNIAKDIRKQAADHNKAVIMPYFASMAKNHNRQNPGTKRATADSMYRRVMNSRQAIAIGKLEKLASSLSNAPPAFHGTLRRLAAGNATIPELMPLANWILKDGTNAPAVKAAALLLKGVAMKRQMTKSLAGKEYIGTLKKAYNKFALQTHGLYKADERDHFFFASTITDEAAQAIEAAGMGTVLKKEVKKQRVRGADREQMVLPREVIETLKEFMQPPSGKFERGVEKVVTKPLNWWKQSKLIHPGSVGKYNLRNLSGDLERVVTVVPSALKHVGKASSEIVKFKKTGHMPSQEFADWWSRGGMDANLQVAEIGEVNRLKKLNHLLVDPNDNIGEKAIQGAGKVWEAVWGTTRALTDIREGVLRYATFLEFQKQIQASATGRPETFGASLREEVMALKDKNDRAYKLSNDLMLAYDEVSKAGQFVRRNIIPFWSFQEKNAQAYKRLVQNAIKDGKASAAIGYAALGGTTAALRTGVWTAMKIGRTVTAALALKTLTELFNHMVMDDEEEDLPESVKKSTHIVLGRDSNGKVRVFSRIGLIDDLLEWGGLDASPYYVREYMNGRMKIEEMAWEMAKSPVNKVAQGITPYVKTTTELAFGKTWFPDVFNQREIRDRGEYIFRELGVAGLYKKAISKPQAPLASLEKAMDFIVYRYDPKETHYNSFRYDKVPAWGLKNDKDLSGGTGMSMKRAALALYDVRMGLRYDDKPAIAAGLVSYAEAGGTKQNLMKAIDRLHPLGALSKHERKEYEQSLSPKESAQLDKAVAFWEEHFHSQRSELESAAREAELPTRKKRK